MKVLLILIVVCYVISQVKSQDDSTTCLDGVIEAKIEAKVAELSKKMEIKYNAIETNIFEMKESIQDNAQAEAICAFKRFVDKTSQTITFDKVHVERNDFGGVLSGSTGIFRAGKAGIYEVSVSIGAAWTSNQSKIDIYLKTSSGRYQENVEGRILYAYARPSKYDIGGPISGSRYMFLDSKEEIFLDYNCLQGQQCKLYNTKMCIAFYSTK